MLHIRPKLVGALSLTEHVHMEQAKDGSRPWDVPMDTGSESRCLLLESAAWGTRAVELGALRLGVPSARLHRGCERVHTKGRTKVLPH